MDLRELRKLEAMRREDRRRARSSAKAKREAAPPVMSDVIANVLGKTPEARRKLLEARLIALWPDMVGTAAAERARAVQVRGRSLTVHVDDPLWLQELMFLKAELIQRFRKALPALPLEDIYFTAPTGGRAHGRRNLR